MTVPAVYTGDVEVGVVESFFLQEIVNTSANAMITRPNPKLIFLIDFMFFRFFFAYSESGFSASSARYTGIKIMQQRTGKNQVSSIT